MIRTGLSQLYVTIPQNCFSFSTVFVSKKNSVFFLLFFFHSKLFFILQDCSIVIPIDAHWSPALLCDAEEAGHDVPDATRGALGLGGQE